MFKKKQAKVATLDLHAAAPLTSNSPHSTSYILRLTSHVSQSTVHSPQSTVCHTSHIPHPTVHVLLLILILSNGCVSPPRNATLIDVPFIPQEQTNQCGVVSLAMAMDFHQVPYKLDVLIDNVYIPTVGGTPINLLAFVAEDYGLQARSMASDISELHSAIAAHNVPIIYLAPIDDSKIGHFVVVTGVSLNNKMIRIHDLHRENRWIKSSAILKRRSNGRFPSVIIGPHPTP